jgi:hypothetical protein
MTPTLKITAEERRRRLAVRHHLAGPASSPTEVARDLVAMHATDAASVFLSLAARLGGLDIKAIESDLYDQRTLARILGMRRTVWVVPVETVPVVHAACTRAIAALERRKLVQMLQQAGIAGDGARWLRRVENATVAALESKGEATASELSAAVPELRKQILFGEGKKWEGYQGVSTRVLFLLAADERIVRGRPRGSWTSTQYRWSPVSAWWPKDAMAVSPEAGRVELARHWLEAFGPAPVADLRWWAGWTVAQTKQALAGLATVDVDLDGQPGIMLADVAGPPRKPAPWAALLPALDPTVMGWSERGWFLGEHRAALFDRSGNAGPTVWWDGRIVGGWAQRKDGEVVFKLLEDVGRDAMIAVGKVADQLQTELGHVRFVPRFRTPLERELVQ